MNAKLAELGPKSMTKNFVRIKDNRNKNLEVTKNHIKIASISIRYMILSIRDKKRILSLVVGDFYYTC